MIPVTQAAPAQTKIPTESPQASRKGPHGQAGGRSRPAARPAPESSRVAPDAPPPEAAAR
jgi:hypothetical protein